MSVIGRLFHILRRRACAAPSIPSPRKIRCRIRSARRATTIHEIEFARDSPLEGAGFEPAVPGVGADGAERAIHRIKPTITRTAVRFRCFAASVATSAALLLSWGPTSSLAGPRVRISLPLAGVYCELDFGGRRRPTLSPYAQTLALNRLDMLRRVAVSLLDKKIIVGSRYHAPIESAYKLVSLRRLEALEGLANSIENQSGAAAARYCHLGDGHHVASSYGSSKEPLGKEIVKLVRIWRCLSSGVLCFFRCAGA